MTETERKAMTESDWNKLLDATPGDHDMRQAFATWLHDQADDPTRAAFQFWMVQEGKWPTPNPLNETENGWAWYYQLEVTEPAKHATLGPWALHHMPQSRWLYPSRLEAEAVLYKAWQSWYPTQEVTKKLRKKRTKQ